MRYAAIATAVMLAVSPAWSDSLFNAEIAKAGPPISQELARYAVGDIITVLVRETVDASTEADTNTKKESELSASANPANNPFLTTPRSTGLFGIPGARLPNWNIEAGSEHKGAGNTSRSNRLVMTVSCVVDEVHPNGNVVIEGRKQVTVNREDSEIFLRGLIRARDVTPENTVLSSQVADAEIRLKGAGPLWNTQRRGLITKLLDWFSPF